MSRTSASKSESVGIGKRRGGHGRKPTRPRQRATLPSPRPSSASSARPDLRVTLSAEASSSGVRVSLPASPTVRSRSIAAGPPASQVRRRGSTHAEQSPMAARRQVVSRPVRRPASGGDLNRGPQCHAGRGSTKSSTSQASPDPHHGTAITATGAPREGIRPANIDRADDPYRKRSTMAAWKAWRFRSETKINRCPGTKAGAHEDCALGHASPRR